jgi:SAM-dependent methyltransferase
MWMAGDFGKIALYSAAEAENFVERLGIQKDARVLDVACGTGNLAIPAARRGARVTGIDIAPNLIEQARLRAAREGIRADFDEGDAEAMPYGDASFDVVMTMYGAMFAPNPRQAAAEMARVCRRGGTIAMANWTPSGFAGKMFAVTSRYAPPPPGMPAPVEWGVPQNVRQRLDGHVSRIEMTTQHLTFDYPYPPCEVVAYFREYFGPVKTACDRMDEAALAAFRRESEALWRDHNEADGDRTLVRAEYLEVVAMRA